MKTLSLFGALLLFISCNNQEESIITKTYSRETAPQNLEVDRVFEKIVGSNIFFKDKKKVVTHLLDMEYIGSIENPKGDTYILVAGNYCKDCNVPKGLYFHNVSEEYMETKEGINRKPFPGKVVSNEDHKSVFSDSRAFYGEIAPGKYGIIWFDYTVLPLGGEGFLTYRCELIGDDTAEETIGGKDALATTLDMVKKGTCKEIPPRTFYINL